MPSPCAFQLLLAACDVVRSYRNRTRSQPFSVPFYIAAATTLYQPICPPGVCVPLGGTKGFMLNEQCTTTFTVMDGMVKGWRREGTACGA